MKENIVDKAMEGLENLSGMAGPEESPVVPAKVVQKPKPKKVVKLPDHIKKAYITINTKSKGNPIVVNFEGDWVPSDINLAGKFLILDFHKFVIDRAMKGK